MATTNRISLRVENAKNMVSQLGNTNCYVFVGRPIAWLTGDENPPIPTYSKAEYYQVFREMLSLKQIISTQVFHGIVKHQWISGEVFDAYSHLTTRATPTNSGATTFYDSNAVVINSNNNVYVCLSNSGAVQSTVEPQSIDDEPFYTADGYQWLRLFNLTNSNIEENSTASFIPVASGADNDVVSTVEGALYTANVNNPGNNYTTSPAGAPNQLPYYFCNILGDGSGAVARVSITEGSVTGIEVVRSGQGYTYASLDFVAGRVYASLTELDAAVNGLNPLGDGTFASTVIIPPAGGWGADLVEQLGATNVMVFSSLEGNDTDFDSGLTYRQIGILSGADNTLGQTTISSAYGINVTHTGQLHYQVGETIAQVVEDEAGNEYTAKGTVVSWDSTAGVLKYIQTLEDMDSFKVIRSFSGTKAIVGQTSGKSSVPTGDTVTINDLDFVAGYSQPEFTHNTGEIIYLSNITPVLRSDTQTEKITMVIRY